jgi:hypothetical protein
MALNAYGCEFAHAVPRPALKGNCPTIKFVSKHDFRRKQ